MSDISPVGYPGQLRTRSLDVDDMPGTHSSNAPSADFGFGASHDGEVFESLVSQLLQGGTSVCEERLPLNAPVVNRLSLDESEEPSVLLAHSPKSLGAHPSLTLTPLTNSLDGSRAECPNQQDHFGEVNEQQLADLPLVFDFPGADTPGPHMASTPLSTTTKGEDQTVTPSSSPDKTPDRLGNKGDDILGSVISVSSASPDTADAAPLPVRMRSSANAFSAWHPQNRPFSASSVLRGPAAAQGELPLGIPLSSGAATTTPSRSPRKGAARFTHPASSPRLSTLAPDQEYPPSESESELDHVFNLEPEDQPGAGDLDLTAFEEQDDMVRNLASPQTLG